MKKIIFALLIASCSLFANSLAQIKEKGLIRIGVTAHCRRLASLRMEDIAVLKFRLSKSS